MRLIATLALSLAFASPASAETSFSLVIASDDMTIRTAKYECGEEPPLSVNYITSETNVLALMPVHGNHTVFVNVVSASGARYVSGRYEWWTTGDHATLTDISEDKPLLQCTSISQ